MALLAAGASRRFGDADKLAQAFGEFRLGEHVAMAIPRARFDCAWVITAQSDHPCMDVWQNSGFEPVINERADEGMGTSVALAMQRAQMAGLDALLIALADMPMVPKLHFDALIAAVKTPTVIAASQRGDIRLPPAMFGSFHFSALAALEGDFGARAILSRGVVVDCPPEWLIDIDTPDALKQYAPDS
ncbi:nucleotidyltransferase family protein [Erythrobacter sp. Alg231-14]|uniref:nucleotidyltransferase family protein n=1 Tax=Erythrobacter sp. Alg231-14 TaxID=1922225 RepID=UPI00307BCEF8